MGMSFGAFIDFVWFSGFRRVCRLVLSLISSGSRVSDGSVVWWFHRFCLVLGFPMGMSFGVFIDVSGSRVSAGCVVWCFH